MFGQVLEKLDVYFGRAFLLARYVPWLLCVAGNAVIASIEYPQIREVFWRAATDLTGERAFAFVIVLLGTWVVAYGTSPVVQFVLDFLEGSKMPGWLRQVLALGHAWRRDALDQEKREAHRRLGDNESFDGLLRELGEAGRVGSKWRAIRDPVAIERAARAVAPLNRARQLIQPVSVAEVRSAVRELTIALRENCDDPDLLAEESDRKRARQLAELQRSMWSRIVPHAKALAEEHDRLTAIERHRRFAERVLAPTGLGNEAAALRSYCATRYGIDFDFFWPRFLLVARGDPKLSDALASAKIQLDFSVVVLTLSSLSLLVWSVVLLWHGTSLLAAAVVAGLGPLVVYGWMGVVQASYAEFADVVRSSIDLRRFDVLTALRQALPASSGDESRCWEAAQRLSMFDEHRANVALRH